jgi:serine/threonine protein kinase
MDTITNYTIKSELGQGGMATVYLAEDKKFLTNVAVKVLAKEFAHNENIRKRFLAEARNMFKMSHPNIIKVSDLIEEGDTVAFVMEYIEGDTLKDYLERKGKLNNDEIKTIFTQMLAAVAYVHEQGLIHRDIKPSNFMISPNGQVKLLDFGIAKNTDTNSAEYTQTSTSQQMGTPMYMSPEQVNETKSVTGQSDIYSLGVVLWQMVMGQKPYDTRTLSNFELQLKIVQEPLALTHTIWDNCIQKATYKNIESRYTSAQLFLNDLQTPETIKDDKTTFEKNDNKTIFENKEEATIVENTKTQTITPKIERAEPASNATASKSKDTPNLQINPHNSKNKLWIIIIAIIVFVTVGGLIFKTNYEHNLTEKYRQYRDERDDNGLVYLDKVHWEKGEILDQANLPLPLPAPNKIAELSDGGFLNFPPTPILDNAIEKGCFPLWLDKDEDGLIGLEFGVFDERPVYYGFNSINECVVFFESGDAKNLTTAEWSEWNYNCEDLLF